jgi:hypothetical protein
MTRCGRWSVLRPCCATDSSLLSSATGSAEAAGSASGACSRCRPASLPLATGNAPCHAARYSILGRGGYSICAVVVCLTRQPLVAHAPSGYKAATDDTSRGSVVCRAWASTWSQLLEKDRDNSEDGGVMNLADYGSASVGARLGLVCVYAWPCLCVCLAVVCAVGDGRWRRASYSAVAGGEVP